MKYIVTVICYFLFHSSLIGQVDKKWYSDTTTNGIRIQNSFPKGGPYKGKTTKYFNHSYLVFYTRITNTTTHTLEFCMDFPGESFPIPNSPDTYMQLLLPSEVMTADKHPLFSYGITELEDLHTATSFQKALQPKEDCLFYAVALFYQTKEDAWQQQRGGNRAELVLKEHELYYSIVPQVDTLVVGQIKFKL